MKTAALQSLAILLMSSLCFQAHAQRPTDGEGAQARPGGSGLGGYTEPTEAGKVPDHLYNIMLGRPTNESMVISVIMHKDAKAYLSYGMESDKYTHKTDVVGVSSRQPNEFLIEGLEKNERYYYQLNYQLAGEDEYQASPEYGFNMPRSSGSEFTFSVQSDSHLDEKTVGAVYLNALTNALNAETDFHLALGDTFMTGKYVKHELSEPHYLAQRYYLGTALTHSAPLFFALGNHDAEGGNRNTDTKAWANKTRNKYFPNPAPNEFYTGNPNKNEEGDFIRNYYAFEWGNSLFIALDPFAYSEAARSGGNWGTTLGKEQYDWLVKTLTESDSAFKFVYLHNLVGGARSGRGGAEASLFYEWGGYNEDGSYGFDEQRAGWLKPIHDLLVENGVSVVFHGHDHMFIQQERDGVVYQLVPQPGHPSGSVNSAEPYGYLSGNIIEGSGTIMVTVSDDEALVKFVDARENGRSGNLLHSYTIKPASL